jgi:arsenite-transporting ATPase
MQEERFREALDCLGDPSRTMIVLVTRPDRGALREAARTSEELAALGLANQMLAVNGRFHASGSGDEIATGLEKDQTAALDGMPSALSVLPRDEFPLLAFDMVGINALEALFSTAEIVPPEIAAGHSPVSSLPPISSLVDELATGSKGLVMVMGKGGVGKTTIAAAVAIGLAARGHPVHLSTTDPAAHVSLIVDGAMAGLPSTASTRRPKPRDISPRSWPPRGRPSTMTAVRSCWKTLHRRAQRKLRSSTPSPG